MVQQKHIGALVRILWEGTTFGIVTNHYGREYRVFILYDSFPSPASAVGMIELLGEEQFEVLQEA